MIRLLLRLALVVLFGVFLLVSLGPSFVFALPVSVVGMVVLTNRRKLSSGTEVLVVGTMEVAPALFLLPGLLSREGVSPANYPLAEGVAALLFLFPPTAFFLVRRRGNGASLTGLVLAPRY